MSTSRLTNYRQAEQNTYKTGGSSCQGSTEEAITNGTQCHTSSSKTSPDTIQEKLKIKKAIQK